MKYRGFAFLTILCLLFAAGVLSAQTKEEDRRELEEQNEKWYEGDSINPATILAQGVDSLESGYVPFGEGERFVYNVQYGIINAGQASMEIRNISEYEGKQCYNIVSDARTNDLFSRVFKVRDRFVSLMDTTALVSLRYETHIREGKFKRDEIVVFDHDSLLARYADKTVAIAPNTQDILSSMYYLRTLPLEVGHAISLANHTNGKNYPLLIKVLREERVSVDAGTFDCIVVEPFLREPGLFRQKGRLTVWVTNDKYRIPVLMKSRVIIGAVSAVLKEYDLAYKERNGQ